MAHVVSVAAKISCVPFESEILIGHRVVHRLDNSFIFVLFGLIVSHEIGFINSVTLFFFFSLLFSLLFQCDRVSGS